MRGNPLGSIEFTLSARTAIPMRLRWRMSTRPGMGFSIRQTAARFGRATWVVAMSDTAGRTEEWQVRQRKARRIRAGTGALFSVISSDTHSDRNCRDSTNRFRRRALQLTTLCLRPVNGGRPLIRRHVRIAVRQPPPESLYPGFKLLKLSGHAFGSCALALLWRPDQCSTCRTHSAYAAGRCTAAGYIRRTSPVKTSWRRTAPDRAVQPALYRASPLCWMTPGG